jgi:hypothetical protein
MDTGGAITAVAATTTVGIGATTMAGGIIAIGGDLYLKAKKGAAVVGGLYFAQCRNQKDFRSLVAIADKPDIASSARFCRE